jgi:hypothetical protein
MLHAAQRIAFARSWPQQKPGFSQKPGFLGVFDTLRSKDAQILQAILRRGCQKAFLPPTLYPVAFASGNKFSRECHARSYTLNALRLLALRGSRFFPVREGRASLMN